MNKAHWALKIEVHASTCTYMYKCDPWISNVCDLGYASRSSCCNFAIAENCCYKRVKEIRPWQAIESKRVLNVKLQMKTRSHRSPLQRLKSTTYMCRFSVSLIRFNYTLFSTTIIVDLECGDLEMDCIAKKWHRDLIQGASYTATSY